MALRAPGSRLRAGAGHRQALTRPLAAKRSPSGPNPGSEARLSGEGNLGAPCGGGRGDTHRRSALRGMFLGMACSPVP